MLTYDLSEKPGALYENLYEFIRDDVARGVLSPGEKLPSKRTLAEHLGISTITVENAYEMLVEEGYIYALPKKGYFVTEAQKFMRGSRKEAAVLRELVLPKEPAIRYNFSSNHTASGGFPFSVWAKIMREVISVRETDLLTRSPSVGVYELRKAISEHLASFRGMQVSPDCIVIGAGTEYLYGLLVKLLSSSRIYCVENPGYQKISQVYESNGAVCRYASMDESGVPVSELLRTEAEVLHISPTHHFPTGITMPLKRRRELLTWAAEKEGRYIIEDDYDSEFRLNGKPLPSLFSIDSGEKVIYMNTFSKSLASTIRISYMVLPVHLAEAFYRNLGFYSCTVSTFEQYTLSEFISRGYFEKHINRMRLQYGRKRKQILQMIHDTLPEELCSVIENDSGLHFLLEFHTALSDEDAKKKLQSAGIRLDAVTDFLMEGEKTSGHRFILNYSNLDLEHLPEALRRLKEIFCSTPADDCKETDAVV